jgi:hypothetical protein
MITSKKLSDKRLEEIKKFPIVYTEDSPKLTAGQIARMKPVHTSSKNPPGFPRRRAFPTV